MGPTHQGAVLIIRDNIVELLERMLTEKYNYGREQYAPPILSHLAADNRISNWTMSDSGSKANARQSIMNSEVKRNISQAQWSSR